MEDAWKNRASLIMMPDEVIENKPSDDLEPDPEPKPKRAKKSVPRKKATAESAGTTGWFMLKNRTRATVAIPKKLGLRDLGPFDKMVISAEILRNVTIRKLIASGVLALFSATATDRPRGRPAKKITKVPAPKKRRPKLFSEADEDPLFPDSWDEF